MLRSCLKRLRPARRRAQSSKDRVEHEVPQAGSAPATVTRAPESSPSPTISRHPSPPVDAFTSTPTPRLRLYTLFHPSSRTLPSPPPYPPDTPPPPACGEGYASFLSSLSDGSGRIFSPCASPTVASLPSTALASKRRAEEHPYAASTSTAWADEGDDGHGGLKSAFSSDDSLSSLGSSWSAAEGGEVHYEGDDEGVSSDAESFRCGGAAAFERAWVAKREALVLAVGG
ncbi:hypothetical protein JCM10450v2_001695 [Rhodotorula kratochvilovae]